MRWTEKHDIFFLREILPHEPYQYKKGSIERGKSWEKIANALNSASQPIFKVKSRAVRDHLNVLIENHKKKTRDEEKASGIDPVESEVDIAVADIIERFKEADETHSSQSDAKLLKEVNNQSKATEMQKRSMETLSETTERNGQKSASVQKILVLKLWYIYERKEKEMELYKRKS